MSSERISPTAFATGYFWYRHGLSHEGLTTPEGKRLDRRFRRFITVTRWLSGVSLEAMMVARHRGIDARLTRAIEGGRVTQVIELAAGLSGRGWRFMQRYPGKLTYVETDLPHMVKIKRGLLERSNLLTAGHRVVELDVLAADGPRSLAAIAASLDPSGGTAILTEGLMSYLEPDTARGLWKRIAESLRGFRAGVYLSDLYLSAENRSAAMKAFRGMLQKFVRGRMYTHFAAADEALATFRSLGFGHVALHETRSIPETREVAAISGGERVRILEASP